MKLGGVQVTGWEPEDLNSVFLHDFKLGPKQSIETAGLDGLVGVVRGSANTLPLARARALDLLNRVQVPQKQFRPDAGAQVEQTLAALESLGLILG